MTHYKSPDGKVEYDRDMNRKVNDINDNKVFLTQKEQNIIIPPYLHDEDYPQRQMRILRPAELDDKGNKIINKMSRNAIVSCDYDNSVVVWKNTLDEVVKHNPFTATAIGFNANDEKIDGDIKPHKGSSSKENTIWDPYRIIRVDKDNTSLEPTRINGIYALENEFTELRRFIQVDVYDKPSKTSADLDEFQSTHMKTIIKAIKESSAVLLAWGGPTPDWNNIEHTDLEELLIQYAEDKYKHVFWLGEVAQGQPVHSNGPIKGGRHLEEINSTTISNIFKKKPSTK